MTGSNLDKPVGELLEVLAAAQKQVTEIQSGGEQLMEIMQFAHNADNFKQLAASLAKTTASNVTQLQALGRQLEGAMKSAHATLRAPGAAAVDPDVIKSGINTSTAYKQWAAANSLLRAGLEFFGGEDPVVWNNSRCPAKRQRTGSMDQLANALQHLVDKVQGVAGSMVKLDLKSAAGTSAKAGEAVEIRLQCQNVFEAIVSLSRAGVPEPVRVIVYLPEDNDRHAWGHSSYSVGRRLSAVATRALYFYLGRARSEEASRALGLDQAVQRDAVTGSSVSGAEALEDLLLWLCTYTDLFSTPCRTTGCLLAADLTSQVLLPPILRPYKLSREALCTAVQKPAKREVYHLHVAPFSMI